MKDNSSGRFWTVAGLVAGLVFFAVSGAITWSNIRTLRETDNEVRNTHEVLTSLNGLLLNLQDAETGQRGYLLTGRESYLEPYVAAVSVFPARLRNVEQMVAGDTFQSANLAELKPHITSKFAEMQRIIDARRAGNGAEALAMLQSDRGKREMDAIRQQVGIMSREEIRQRKDRIEAMSAAARQALGSVLITALTGLALTVAIFLLVRRSMMQRLRQNWLSSGEVGLAQATRGDKTVEQIGHDVLVYLAQYLGFEGGAVFKGEGGTFRRVATLGVPASAPMPEVFEFGDGLLGKVAESGDAVVLTDVPESYLSVGSAFGSAQPRHIVVAPATADGAVNAVIELGFFNPVPADAVALLAQTADAFGVALRSARFRDRLQNALEETQRQSAELQAQSEELRVSNEELEEQGRALKESQVRLEQQQAELEQTNSELEEQAQLLETQRDQLEKGSAALTVKARELEQASQYKSDFLANMSHELRTPLNSLLILSKLLGDNPDGNLSDDQIKFARTIESSGNDLLTLINDILDLSKIEAGHVQIQPETVSLQRLEKDLGQVFSPVADQRGVSFTTDLVAGLPGGIETDRLRLEQILRNLLSNAFKFTDKGSVTLRVAPADEGQIAFAVEDTGIGISPDQQQSIFEAFQQADGTISRRFGGTGLGLSISRELARLLGGAITLDSTPNKGSTFTLTIPAAYDASRVAARTAVPVAPVAIPAGPPTGIVAAPKPAPAPRRPRGMVEDDRNNLDRSRRVLLVIEDDAAFAAIVSDLSKQMGFQCLVASTAEEAVRLAGEYRPNAIVLDLGLPDQSGLTVLDRLKHDDATRHIPVHVISGSDYSQTALSLGAVGYHIKPIRHEELAEVLGSLQDQLSTTVRRVLIVEDDSVQRDAVRELLKSDDVETVAVGSAAECLDALAEQTFDCMVLDLTLPDVSGFDLLETLSSREDRSFPPVIVYTGHDLSTEDEQRLRRYSSSIIIKGAKSPERLLDEVSLFLHRVVADLPPEQRQMIEKARFRDAALEGRRILIVEDDVRNVYSLTSVFEPRGASIAIARNGQEALDALAAAKADPAKAIDLVLMDVMMPIMDGLTATREIRKNDAWRNLPIVMLTAKAMPDDQERCLEAGANDYMAKPIDVDKLLSLVRVWMPR